MPISSLEKNSQLSSFVSSKFGEIEINLDRRLAFPRGIIGLKNLKNFSVCDLPIESDENFKILQSLDNSEFSFLILPIDPEDNDIFDKNDTMYAAKELQICFDDLVLFVIASVLEDGDKINITFNTKAPLFVDSVNRRCFQSILESHKYRLNDFLFSCSS